MPTYLVTYHGGGGPPPSAEAREQMMAAFGAWVASVGDHVPRIWWAQLPYYLVAGTAWGLPVIPLIIWMNRGR